MSHTPTPLKLSLNEANWASHIVDPDGETVCSCEGTMPQAEQRAAHIVHCVNVHDQLVAALKDMHEVLSDLLEDPHAEMTTQRYAALQAIDKSNQALAAAEKGA